MFPFGNSGKEQRGDSRDSLQSEALQYVPDLLVGNPNQRFLVGENRDSAA